MEVGDITPGATLAADGVPQKRCHRVRRWGVAADALVGERPRPAMGTALTLPRRPVNMPRRALSARAARARSADASPGGGAAGDSSPESTRCAPSPGRDPGGVGTCDALPATLSGPDASPGAEAPALPKDEADRVEVAREGDLRPRARRRRRDLRRLRPSPPCLDLASSSSLDDVRSLEDDEEVAGA